MAVNEEEDIKELVFVVENNRVRSREVTVGIQDEAYIEILSGLKPGEEVVVLLVLTAPFPNC